MTPRSPGKPGGGGGTAFRRAARAHLLGAASPSARAALVLLAAGAAAEGLELWKRPPRYEAAWRRRGVRRRPGQGLHERTSARVPPARAWRTFLDLWRGFVGVVIGVTTTVSCAGATRSSWSDQLLWAWWFFGVLHWAGMLSFVAPALVFFLAELAATAGAQARGVPLARATRRWRRSWFPCRASPMRN